MEDGSFSLFKFFGRYLKVLLVLEASIVGSPARNRAPVDHAFTMFKKTAQGSRSEMCRRALEITVHESAFDV